jgi:hypothetical protein
MFDLLESKDDVTLEHVQHLLSLSFEFNLVAARHASLYLHDELFTFLDDSLALAVLAVLGVNLAFALALATRLLSLELHEAHVNELNCDTLSFTFRAGLAITTLGPAPLALRAVHVAIDCIYGTVPDVQLF